MKVRFFTYLFISIILLISILMHVSGYAETLKDVIDRKYKETKDICLVVKQAIEGGANTKEVIKTAISSGHDACTVIKCGIQANGNLEQIITGALEAGTTTDITSKCAIDAGVDTQVIAKILETGLGYTPLEAGLTLIEVGLPGGNPGGGIVSPHRP